VTGRRTRTVVLVTVPVVDEVPAEEKGERRADDKAMAGLKISFREMGG
jgi:hypothetical protein